jgi:hypothetical protein
VRRYQYVGASIPPSAGSPIGGIKQGVYVYATDTDMLQTDLWNGMLAAVSLHPDGPASVLLPLDQLRLMPTKGNVP